MMSLDTYGYSGVGTFIGVVLGLLFGFLIGEVEWSAISCTAIGSLLGTILDKREIDFRVKTSEIQITMQPAQLDD